MPGQTLASITAHACYVNRKLDPPFVRQNAIASFEELWRSHPWRFRLVRGQIAAVADYSTGGITALTQGAVAVTGSGTTWGAEYVLRHLRPSNTSSAADSRDYLITARGSDTALTIEDAYEGTTISSSTSYNLYKRWYQLPPDFGHLAHVKETATAQVLGHISREEFEDWLASPDSSGSPYWIVDAGNTRQTLYSTGTVTMTRNSATVTGSSTVFNEARDKGHRFRVRGMTRYGDFTIIARVSDTEVTLDREWKGDTKSGLAYDIDPAGEPLVELYPRPTSPSSIALWYYRNLPPIELDTEAPYGLPLEFHDAWLYGTLARLGIVSPTEYQNRLGPLLQKQKLEVRPTFRSQPYGSKGTLRRSLMPSNYPAYFER